MAIKQYVGARYVPKFATPIEWQENTYYEGMVIVTYNNSSYTSKKAVPSTVGNPSQNSDYWVLTGNYNAQVEEYRQEVSKLNDKLTTFTTPEQFGAIGDGVTDDTNALQTAIEYCETNGVTLISSSDKKYKITSSLLITKSNLVMNFGNATLINNTGEYALYVNKDATDWSDSNNVKNVCLSNLIVDANGNSGLNIATVESRVTNVQIENVALVGINARLGGGTTFEKISIVGTTSKQSIGVVVGSSDNIFNQINGKNCYTFIQVNSPCELTKLHSWIGKTELYNGSTFVEINCETGTILRDSNVDTYSIVFKFNNQVPSINMMNCVVIYNNSFIQDTDTSYFYYQSNSSSKYERGFEQIVGCIINSATKGTYYISNTVTTNKRFCINTTSSHFPTKSHDETNISEFNNNNTFEGQMVINYGKYIRIVGSVTVTSTDKNLLYLSAYNSYFKFPKVTINATLNHNGTLSSVPLTFNKQGDTELYVQKYDASNLTVGDVYYIDTTISWIVN